MRGGILLGLGWLGGWGLGSPIATAAEAPPDLGVFLQLVDRDLAKQARAYELIEAHWDSAFIAPLVDLAALSYDDRIFPLLQRRTGEKRRNEVKTWLDYLWAHDYRVPEFYPEFKARLFGLIDPRFNEYFAKDRAATIRLDEIRWGGVKRDGIPPLKNPAMITAAEATYLKDSNVVFGVTINGDSRAYPKRILAWHEMVKDRIGGEEMNGVYCTLCGSMVLYRTEIGGQHYELGTSGFLYRSNKLMYDHGTKSLWSTLTGEPVVGPLVGRGLKLTPLFVVTTTWGEWRRRHPETKVLSLKTGHERDYGEGVAYRNYFATDELMFSVPQLDGRLKNKAEVLALRFGGPAVRPAAVSVEFLRKNPIFHGRLGTQDYVVLTDASGGNRAFETGGRKFSGGTGDAVRDERGRLWRMTEPALVSESGEELARLPAHRAFWFGWFSAFPETELIK
ncbi:MAG: DUF3179 domain-containing protein [Opitutaceae bacterium]